MVVAEELVVVVLEGYAAGALMEVPVLVKAGMVVGRYPIPLKVRNGNRRHGVAMVWLTPVVVAVVVAVPHEIAIVPICWEPVEEMVDQE